MCHNIDSRENRAGALGNGFGFRRLHHIKSLRKHLHVALCILYPPHVRWLELVRDFKPFNFNDLSSIFFVEAWYPFSDYYLTVVLIQSASWMGLYDMR